MFDRMFQPKIVSTAFNPGTVKVRLSGMSHSKR